MACNNKDIPFLKFAILSFNSESNLLTQHLPKTLEGGDLLLLDRGYPSYWLLFLLTAKKLQFCVRLKSTWWNKVREFTQSSEKERIVTFRLPKKDRKKTERISGVSGC